MGLSAWPGGYMSWGDQRIWVVPVSGTETFGRSGFSIHGGLVLGSAGCIDLGIGMSDFAKVFRDSGDDMILSVNY